MSFEAFNVKSTAIISSKESQQMLASAVSHISDPGMRKRKFVAQIPEVSFLFALRMAAHLLLLVKRILYLRLYFSMTAVM
jgi:hypothetical protein